MSIEAYSAPVVDEILEASTRSMESLMSAVSTQQAEIAQLKEAARQQSAEVVRLEKVASEKIAPPPSNELNGVGVARLVDQLIANDYLNPKEREKMAHELINDPNQLLKLASQIISISSGASSQGHGVTKAASDGFPVAPTPDGWVEDGWDAVVAN
jgi:hypothetical protein